MKITAEELKYFAKHFLKKITMDPGSYYHDMARLKLNPKLAQTAKNLSQAKPEERVYINKVMRLAVNKRVFSVLGQKHRGFHNWISRLYDNLMNYDAHPKLIILMDEAVELIKKEESNL